MNSLLETALTSRKANRAAAAQQYNTAFEYVLVHIKKDLLEHSGFVQHNDFAFRVAVRTRVNNTVHIQIKVVDFEIRTEAFFHLPVENIGILVCQPPKHFGNTKECRC